PATGAARPAGVRFATGPLTDVLLAAAGGPRLGKPLREGPDGAPLVLATGGFQGDRELLRRHVTPEADHLMLRAAPWSAGDGLRIGLEAGARSSAGMDQVYGRNMPAPPARVGPADFVGLAQLYARHARVEQERGERTVDDTCSELDVLR